MKALTAKAASGFADPYLAWTVHTGFQGHEAARADANVPIPVLIEASARQRAALTDRLTVQPAWRSTRARYFTATIDRNDLAAVEPLVGAMEFALPLPAGDAVESRSAAPSKEPFVLAVIDRGCGFLNANFCVGQPQSHDRARSRTTRLIALWDQGQHARSGSAWRQPDGFSYGRELDAEAIDALLEQVSGAAARTTEAPVYRQLNYLLDGFGQLRASAHGTHVLDTAGGSVDVNPPRSSAKPGKPDSASVAPLIFVDVPSLSPGDTTGASPGVFLLDALRYIRLRAGKAQVVVNISLGAFAGPHDGSSLVERAIDDFVAKDGRMLITVAAGNAARERWHASGDLADADAAAELHWRTMPEDETDSFLEVWFSAARSGQTGAVQIKVTPPRGKPTDWLDADGLSEVCDDDGRTIAAVIGRRPNADQSAGQSAGQSDGMFLVAVTPTAGSRRSAPPGLWRIALRNAGKGRIATRFDAWIQRDEPAWSAGPSVQSYFQSASPGVTVGGPAGALSSLATGNETIVVGAASLEDRRVARYSSFGGRPRRDGKHLRDIDAVAAADESQTAIGLLAAGVPSFTQVRMGGTSVAVPAAARQIYNALVKRGSAAPKRHKAAELTPMQQLREALRQRRTRTRKPGSRGDPPPVALLDPAHPLPL